MLEELKAQYRLTFPEKVKTIRSLLSEYRSGKTEVLASLRLLAHSLHGSGTTFGYPEISEAARKVEHANPEVMLKELAHLVRVLLHATCETAVTLAQTPVLIIEDDPDISNLLKVLLTQKSERYQVTVAANTGEATARINQQQFALVVLDLVLPDGDGRVLLREIRAGVAATVPVFVLSGIDRQSIRDECLALGAQRYFNKPFNPAVIATMIDMELNAPAAVTPPVHATGATPDTAPTGKIAGARVLLAEDDELLAGIIKHRLTRDGFEVVHVTSGADAMQAVAESGWNLVILDVKMPVHDGFEVLVRIRSLPTYKNVPVIMLTAMGSEKDVVRGYDMGASDYIVKPFSPVELLARVKSLIKT